MEDKLETIFEGLKQKSTTKQTIYRNTQEVFEKMRLAAAAIVTSLSTKITEVDSNVIIEYRNINEFEFHIKFSGDLLIFVMHSNVITFPEDHELMSNPYVEEDFRRRFFGHIMAYNFMADSIKYNRMNDPGYLLARILINVENHYYLEGVSELDLEYSDISKNVVDDKALRLFIESAMVASVNNDLIAPAIDDIKKISVKQKMENQQVSRGQKLGFSFSYEGNSNNFQGMY
ncbi:hypothetical protein [Adhaeribacter pallidiroseus]|uniref:Uncharacterized protein n=1 Tax=Adhaeribacter pallidiroseus TaxID=2072847 RepID=A0A369QEL7_9BACT|nr:hypothetical protein [Adhaeribacter pallidiroseus]RDC63361.1 hypothetical protein AHMF7616_01964 [Adhaeribacter pallidiroseus]